MEAAPVHTLEEVAQAAAWSQALKIQLAVVVELVWLGFSSQGSISTHFLVRKCRKTW